MKRSHKHSRQTAWLPIDSRVFPSIISFGHVKGMARVFLTIEMILTVLTVFGTLVLIFLK